MTTIEYIVTDRNIAKYIAQALLVPKALLIIKNYPWLLSICLSRRDNITPGQRTEDMSIKFIPVNERIMLLKHNHYRGLHSVNTKIIEVSALTIVYDDEEVKVRDFNANVGRGRIGGHVRSYGVGERKTTKSHIKHFLQTTTETFVYVEVTQR